MTTLLRSYKLVALLVTIALGVLVVACRAPSSGAGAGELALTFVTDSATAHDLLGREDLSDVLLAETPLLTTADFTGYDLATHVFTLTVAATERVAALQVPTNGRPFVVTVDDVPIYAGAFWAPYSSLSFEGVTIWVMPGWSAGALFPEDSRTFAITLGYPGSGFFTGPDPRDDPRIVDALRAAGLGD